MYHFATFTFCVIVSHHGWYSNKPNNKIWHRLSDHIKSDSLKPSVGVDAFSKHQHPGQHLKVQDIDFQMQIICFIYTSC